MNTKLVTGLLRLARRIGAWLLRHLVSRGISLLVGYMDGKVGDFERRLARARTPRRKAWLRGRIRRWRAAIAWLQDNREDSHACAAAAYDVLTKHKELPVVAQCERLVAA